MTQEDPTIGVATARASILRIVLTSLGICVIALAVLFAILTIVLRGSP